MFHLQKKVIVNVPFTEDYLQKVIIVMFHLQKTVHVPFTDVSLM
jgi:hypothetical protein